MTNNNKANLFFDIPAILEAPACGFFKVSAVPQVPVAVFTQYYERGPAVLFCIRS